MKLSAELVARGFIHQFTGESLEHILDGEKRTVYHGIDPSADSAHAGNFVNWMLLRHLAQAGHNIVFLVGGGTGMIGDPKPDAERELKSIEAIDENVKKLHAQATNFFSDIPGEITFVNNYEWLSNLKFIDFLRDIGKHFTVNELIKKDAISRRLASDTGLSYTEFAYPLMQGYDYLQLYRTRSCTLQVGGSDQWANIVAGVDLVRRKEKAEVYAITVPLIIDKATGKKFGKSEGNAVWIDPVKTSPYHFYQFWLNVSDESVIDYLKVFTLLRLDEIAAIEQAILANPSARIGQKQLAEAVTTLVHGKNEATAAQAVTEVLFGEGTLAELSDEQRQILVENAPVLTITQNQPVVDVLVAATLATSKREARTFIESGAISLNTVKVTAVDAVITEADCVAGLAILQRGKKHMTVLQMQ